VLLCAVGREEPIRRFETHCYGTFCATSSWVAGSLIQAMSGTCGGWEWFLITSEEGEETFGALGALT